jgi:hypothetical protein
MRLFLLFLFAAGTMASAQNNGVKPTVFKVRSPHAVCSVFVEDSTLWLEKNNRIRVKVRSNCESIKVVFDPGKIVAQDGDLYTVNFSTVGSTVISVYEVNNHVKKLIHCESLKIREPDIYFCGIKVSTFKHSLPPHGDALRIYSIPLDTDLGVVGFDMNYNNGIKTKTFHVNDNKLTNEMIDVMFKDNDPAVKKKTVNKGIYFNNITASLPDGSTKILSPFALSVVRDTTNKEGVVFNFVIRKMVMKKE